MSGSSGTGLSSSPAISDYSIQSFLNNIFLARLNKENTHKTREVQGGVLPQNFDKFHLINHLVLGGCRIGLYIN